MCVKSYCGQWLARSSNILSWISFTFSRKSHIFIGSLMWCFFWLNLRLIWLNVMLFQLKMFPLSGLPLALNYLKLSHYPKSVEKLKPPIKSQWIWLNLWEKNYFWFQSQFNIENILWMQKHWFKNDCKFGLFCFKNFLFHLWKKIY